jgi:uncharacterized membrane protein required for colicin V production
MKLEDLGIGWIDLIIGILLVVGLVRGHKRGISEELLNLIKWALILVTGAFCYEPLGGFLSTSTMFSRLTGYVTTYFAIIFVYFLVFSFLRRQIGGKLLGNDFFGRAEYHLGMCAGGVRYACVILVTMALLHARYYSPAEMKAHLKYQEDNFGSAFFPTPCSMQHQLFAQSALGRLTEEYLPVLLIKSTPPEEKGLSSANIIKAREANVYEILGK